jgi:hypothetical protein
MYGNDGPLKKTPHLHAGPSGAEIGNDQVAQMLVVSQPPPAPFLGSLLSDLGKAEKTQTLHFHLHMSPRLAHGLNL